MTRPPLRSGAAVVVEHLPIGKSEATAVRPDGPIRVLVVDDDPRVRAAIGQTIALETDLVMVAVAADADTALSLAEWTDPSVALVDVLLPDTPTGLALVRRLAERPGCSVVAMSIRGGHRRDALAAGAVALVEKGGDIEAILDAIRVAVPARGV